MSPVLPRPFPLPTESDGNDSGWERYERDAAA